MEYKGQFWPDEPKKKKGAFGVVVIVLIVILIAAVCVLLAITLGRAGWQKLGMDLDLQNPGIVIETPAPAATAIPYAEPTATPRPEDREAPALDGTAPAIDLSGDNPIPDIFDSIAPSVVGVINYTMQNYGGKQMLAIYGSGSGFIVSTKGYVLTNAHVIQDAQVVTVLLPSGDEVDAAVLGKDAETDIAVLKIEKDGLTALALGDSDAVRVGEYVLAIGNPLDTEKLANTLTFGIISAKSREVTIDGHTNEYLQTDAAINYGNSGGPLLNLKGEVIGMNSAKSITAGYDAYGNSVSAEGIGFALPINAVVDVMEQLIRDGAIRRPAVGITVYSLTEAMAAELDVPQGVYVESVVRGGPGAAAGLVAGDVILAADGRAIADQKELIAIINERSVGDSIELRVYRDGEERICTITLGDKNIMDFNAVDEQTKE